MFRLAVYLFLLSTAQFAAAQGNLFDMPDYTKGAQKFMDVSYGEHDRHKYDIAVPKTGGPYPLIIWIHGGGWEMGSKSGFGPVTAHQITRGYAIAGINYRLSKHAVFPAQILDVKNAVRHIKANAKKYNIDPDRIGVLGMSAGAHLGVLLNTSNGVKELDEPNASPDETKIKCVINLFGPAELMRLSPPGSPENPVTRFIGGDTGEKRTLALLGTPQTHIDAKDAPVLNIHGDRDPVVPVSQSERLHESLKQAGVKTDLIIIKGALHGPGVFTYKVDEACDRFFDEHLKLSKTAAK